MSIVLNLVSKREINREYTESIGFLIVCASIGVFRILEYIFAYLFNKFDFWLNDIVKYKNMFVENVVNPLNLTMFAHIADITTTKKLLMLNND